MIRYGCSFKEGTTDAEIELACFHHNVTEEEGGLGRFGHLRNAIDLIINKKVQAFIWNEWTELMLRAFCENREVSLAGPGASWKTTCMALYAIMCWLSSPLDTRIIITSTTLDGLRARIWKEIVHFYRITGQPFGNSINHPHPQIQSIKGDIGTGIFGIAVEAGDAEKAIENIKGRHAPNTYVFIDEMTGVSAAIVDAGANLEKGTKRFQMIGSANPVSYFDQHGLFSEPVDGWESVTVESEKWRTKRGGICIHLDGLKAPNVLARKKKYPGMISEEDVEISKQRDHENSPKFWTYVRGFWAPEGITKTVLTQSIIERFKAREQPVWVDEPQLLAALDPAYEGGDRKILGFAKVGRIDDNGTIKTALSFTEVLSLKLDVTKKEPIHYQLARQTREECKARAVKPSHFGMDSTGEGGGTSNILKREWSSEFLEVEFGGRASDRPVSDINPRKGWEEYVNRVSELWYQVRTAVERGQIRGMTIEMAREFCERNYEMRGNLIIVESKSKMKARIGHSPDVADMAAVMIETALVRGLLSNQSILNPDMKTKQDEWADFAKKMILLSDYAEA